MSDPKQHEITRWHELDNPLSPFDPIGHASMFKEGHLPARFVLLLWDGHALRGPMKFHSQLEADSYLKMCSGVVAYLPIPKP